MCELVDAIDPSAATLGFSIPVLSAGLRAEAGYRLFVAVQPFDDVMANYTSRNSDNK